MSKEHGSQPQPRRDEMSNAVNSKAAQPARTARIEREQPRRVHKGYCCDLAAITNPEQSFRYRTMHSGMCESVLLFRELQLKWYM